MSKEEEINVIKAIKESVEFIQHPNYFTNHGNRYSFAETDGTPHVGSEVEKQESGRVKVLSSTTNSDCVGGVCPIR